MTGLRNIYVHLTDEELVLLSSCDGRIDIPRVHEKLFGPVEIRFIRNDLADLTCDRSARLRKLINAAFRYFQLLSYAPQKSSLRRKETPIVNVSLRCSFSSQMRESAVAERYGTISSFGTSVACNVARFDIILAY